MCDYCQNCRRIIDENLGPFIPNLSVNAYLTLDGYLNVSGTLMSDRYNGKTKAVSSKINYCPMCGRKLTD